MGDAELIHIMDAALADATKRSGQWLACKPGCNQCCTGVFRVSQADAARLRYGLDLLRQVDSLAAAQVISRVQTSIERLTSNFPGDPQTGTLGQTDEATNAFEDFANEEVCPILDPEHGTCTLYAHRPMTCRSFGPPVRTDEGAFGVCELCFQGASEEEISHAELMLPATSLDEELSAATGRTGETTVTFAFAREVYCEPEAVSAMRMGVGAEHASEARLTSSGA